MSEQKSLEIQTILDAAGWAKLPMSETRAASLKPALEETLRILDSLDPSSLDETPPAFAFHALWEGEE